MIIILFYSRISLQYQENNAIHKYKVFFFKKVFLV